MTRSLALALALFALAGTAQEPKKTPPPGKEVPLPLPSGKVPTPTSILGTLYRWYEFLAQVPPAEKEPNAISIRLNLKDVKIAELAKQLKVKLDTVPEGKGDAKLDLRIPIDKSDDIAAYRATGSISLRDLKYGAISVPELSSDVALANGLLTLTNARAKLFDGEAKATLRYPVAGNEPGSLDGSFTNIPLERFGEWGGEAKGGKSSFPVGGRADGTIKAVFPAASAPASERTRIDLAVTKGEVTFSGLKVDKLAAFAERSDGRWNYRVDGDALGGKVEVSGQYPAGPAGFKPPDGMEPPTKDDTDKIDEPLAPPVAAIRIRDVALSKLLRQFTPRLPLPAQGLRGRVNLTFVLREDAAGDYTGVGQIRLEGLRVREEEWVRVVSARLRLTKTQIRVTDVQALFGDGSIRGSLFLSRDLSRGPKGRFTVTASDAPLEKLLAPFTDSASALPIAIEGSLRGTIGDDIRASGTLGASRGKLLGGAVSDLQVPIDISYEWRGGRIEVMARDLSGRLAGGRVSGRAELSGSTRSSLRAEIDAKFDGVDIATLAGGLDKVTSGQKLTGRLILTADDATDQDSFRGALSGRLSEGRPFQLPVLDQVARYLGPGRDAQTRAETGEIRADLSRGVINIRQFALAGRSVDLLLSGKVTTRGLLDLSVVATSGPDVLNPVAFSVAGIPISTLATTALPVGQIATISRFLSNRTVVLSVSGTTASPQVRVETLATLQEAVVRYFLNTAQARALGIGGLAGVAGLSGTWSR